MIEISNSTRRKINQVKISTSDNFVELVRLANLDPKHDFVGAKLNSVDFKDCDLTDFNFEGAHMISCSLIGASLGNARFDDAVLVSTDIRQASDWNRWINLEHSGLRIEAIVKQLYRNKILLNIGNGDKVFINKDDVQGSNELTEGSKVFYSLDKHRNFFKDDFLNYNHKEKNVSIEEFSFILDEAFSESEPQEGSVIKGTVIGIEKDMAIIDVGLKVEGRVALKEFGAQAKDGGLEIGSEVEVYLERIENAMGEAVLSRDKARREESWGKLEKAFEAEEKVTGTIFDQIKGGFIVDLDGAVAFLPRSQVDIRPVRDVTQLMHNPQPFQILKMDKLRGNIVVSRRVILEETHAELHPELVQNLKEGQTVEGVVKNITDYGAFVDLGGIDGLLHVTDIAWRRINHPSEVLSIGQTVKVQIVRVNQETHRISLGMKQLEVDPWSEIEQRYPVGEKFTGRVTNITDYGAFLELEPGIEGLIHVSEMSWTKKNVHPGKIVSTSQEVEVMILEVDPVKRRVSLGLKQTLDNPWAVFAENHPAGTVVEGEVKNKTEFGLFIGLEGEVDGMVHLSDLDWNRPGEQVLEEFNKGDVVKAVILDVDVDKERISLGIKQLESDPFEDASGEMKRGAIVSCEITEVKENGLEVKVVGSDMTAFIRRADLARDRADQRTDRFQVGETVDARITQFDKKNRKLGVSIKALEVAEEKEAIAQFGSSEAGASLGDILGAALKARGDD